MAWYGFEVARLRVYPELVLIPLPLEKAAVAAQMAE